MGNFFDDLEYKMGLHYDFDPSTAEELSENPGAPAKIDDNTISETSTYSSSKIEDKISQIVGFKMVIVSQLPQTGEEQTLYLVPSTDPSDANLYNEYMWVDGAWEMVGSTTIDLSNYYTSGQTDQLLALKQNTLVQGQNITIDGNTISAADTKYTASDFDIKDLSDSTNLRTTWSNKQDTISDLTTIRSGAALGATALQSVPSEYVTDTELNTALGGYYTSGQTDEKLEEISYVTSSHINELHDDVDNINTELTSKVGSTSITTIWKGTQAEYDAITTKDNNTFYIITE